MMKSMMLMKRKKKRMRKKKKKRMRRIWKWRTAMLWVNVFGTELDWMWSEEGMTSAPWWNNAGHCPRTRASHPFTAVFGPHLLRTEVSPENGQIPNRNRNQSRGRGVEAVRGINQVEAVPVDPVNPIPSRRRRDSVRPQRANTKNLIIPKTQKIPKWSRHRPLHRGQH